MKKLISQKFTLYFKEHMKNEQKNKNVKEPVVAYKKTFKIFNSFDEQELNLQPNSFIITIKNFKAFAAINKLILWNAWI